MANNQLNTFAAPPTIEATVRVDVNRRLMWVLGSPWDIMSSDMSEEEAEVFHNCDAMGCGSAGQHVLAIVRLGEDGGTCER